MLRKKKKNLKKIVFACSQESKTTDYLIIINFAELNSQNYFSHSKVGKGKKPAKQEKDKNWIKEDLKKMSLTCQASLKYFTDQK